MDIKLKIKNALTKATGLLVNDIELETPEKEEFGDYSSNVAMQLSSKCEAQSAKSPRKLAHEIVNKLMKDKDLLEIVDRVEVAGLGFINFHLSNQTLLNELQRILGTAEDYGESSVYEDKKIMVEFAHPNTHKELHIGHMRTLILGEALSRIFSFAKADVFRANYQGDIGPHVAKSIWGTRRLMRERNLSWDNVEEKSLSEKAHLLGEGYVLANKKYEENRQEIDALNTKIYKKDSEVLEDYERTRRWSLEYYDSFYSRFGTKFDRLYFESEIADKGKEIVLKSVGRVFEKSEGAVIFNGEKYGLHKRVFITKDNNPTYEAKDMALAPLQYSDFPFDVNVHVVANEQKDYFKVIFKALESVDENFRGREYHLPMGMVNLVGRKMSSRTGDIYTVDQLLEDVKKLVVPLIKDKGLSRDEKENIAEQVTVASVKYSLLKVSPNADVCFDLKNSVSVEGDSGPYLQYTYARTQSVMRKSEASDTQHGTNPNSKNRHNPRLKKYLENLFENGNRQLEVNPEELSLLRIFIKFPEIVEAAAENYAPNFICNYLYNLAQKYNFFYQKHRILVDVDSKKLTVDGDNKNIPNPDHGSVITTFRLALTSATGQILKNGLNLLGIQVPGRM